MADASRLRLEDSAREQREKAGISQNLQQTAISPETGPCQSELEPDAAQAEGSRVQAVADGRCLDTLPSLPRLSKAECCPSKVDSRVRLKGRVPSPNSSLPWRCGPSNPGFFRPSVGQTRSKQARRRFSSPLIRSLVQRHPVSADQPGLRAMMACRLSRSGSAGWRDQYLTKSTARSTHSWRLTRTPAMWTGRWRCFFFHGGAAEGST